MGISKKHIKSLLTEAFEAPVPVHKKEFLRTIKKPGISMFSFIVMQMFYIRKIVWLISAAFVVMLAFFSRYDYIGQEMQWIISACIPFIAMLAMTENMRSKTYNMAELEMSARFSLKSVIYARLIIMGVFHFICLLFLIPFAAAEYEVVSFLQAGIYLMIPYLFTSALSLVVTRKVRGGEINYICMAVAAGVSVMEVVMNNMLEVRFYTESLAIAVIIFVLLIIVVAVECKKLSGLAQSEFSLN